MAKYIKAFCGYCEFAENCEKHFFECDKHEVFAEIAKDQQKRDIEKACEWLLENVRPYYKFSLECFKNVMEE